MVAIRFFSLFLISIFLIWVIVYGVNLIRKAIFETDKIFALRYLIVLIITFFAGGITRVIQQYTRVEWLNGFVPFFGGLLLSLMGIPFVWQNSQNKFNGLIRFLFFLLGLFTMFLGLGTIYLGITQVWKAFL